MSVTIQDVHHHYKNPGKTKIYYYKNSELSMDVSLAETADEVRKFVDPDNLDKTHALVGAVDDDDLERIFEQLNFGWGDARQLICGKGLRHTSMSVGDIIVMDNKVWMCMGFGFTEL